MAEKARAIGVSSSSLSHWLHGRRLPRPEAMKALVALVQDAGEGEEGQVGRDFARAEELLRAARRMACRHCADECVCRQGLPVRDRRNDIPGGVGEGDRRNGRSSAAEKLPMIDRIAALSPPVRAAVLWSLGASLQEGEIGVLAAALGRARMHSEMEVILRSAESAGRDSVKIALAAAKLA
ncbi:hypothetical protein ACWDCL_05950 [Streptomyces sp. NPDC001009]